MVVMSDAVKSAGRYQLVGGSDQRRIWRIDTLTGNVSMCETYTGWQTGPVCSAWGAKPLPPELLK